MNRFENNFLNVFLGALSILAILSGFFIDKYKFLFWSIGSALLIVISLSYYVIENKNKIDFLLNKIRKIEESLNIYDRLNKLEAKII